MVNILGGLGGLVGGFFQQKANKTQGKLEKLKANYGLAQAIRNRQKTEYDAYLSQRMAEEKAADSGTYDPSEALNVGVQSVNRQKKQNQFALDSAADAENYAHKNLSTIKKAIKQQRQMYYMQQAMNLLQMGYGAYNLFPSGAPPVPPASQGQLVGGQLPASTYQVARVP